MLVPIQTSHDDPHVPRVGCDRDRGLTTGGGEAQLTRDELLQTCEGVPFSSTRIRTFAADIERTVILHLRIDDVLIRENR